MEILFDRVLCKNVPQYSPINHSRIRICAVLCVSLHGLQHTSNSIRYYFKDKFDYHSQADAVLIKKHSVNVIDINKKINSFSLRVRRIIRKGVRRNNCMLAAKNQDVSIHYGKSVINFFFSVKCDWIHTPLTDDR